MKLTILLVLLSSTYILAQTHEEWEEKYRVICSYDTWCTRLKEDNVWVKPNKQIALLLEELGPVILKTAQKTGVSPESIVGSILAENTLNVSITDDVQNFLVKYGLAENGKILGKDFTFGLGQLNHHAAMIAEEHMAKLEKRDEKTESEISEALLSPEGAIYYVAGVIRHAQDVYKDHGMDISHQPEILATLYNLGKVEEKAEQSKKNGALPKPNFFGFFVQKNLSEIKAIAHKNAPNEKPSTPGDLRFILRGPADLFPNSIADKKASPSSAKIPDLPKIEIKILSKPLALYQSPPSCIGDRSYKYASYANFPVVKISETNQGFKEVAPGLDCEANVWKLIALDDGSKGWVKEEELKVVTSSTVKTFTGCDMKSIDACRNRINETVKNYLPINNDEEPEGNEDRLIFVSPVSSGDSRGSFQSNSCSGGYSNPYMSSQFPSSGFSGGMVGGMSGGYYGGLPGGNGAQRFEREKLSEKEKKEALKELTQIEVEITNLKDNIFKIYPEDSISNPYDKPLNILGQIKKTINTCAEFLRRDIDCKTENKFDLKNLKDLSIWIRKTPKYTDIQELYHQLWSIQGSLITTNIDVTGIKYSSSADELRNLVAEELVTKMKACSKKMQVHLDGIEDTYTQLASSLKEIDQEKFQKTKALYNASLKVCEDYLSLMEASEEECEGQYFASDYRGNDLTPSKILQRYYKTNPDSFFYAFKQSLDPITSTILSINPTKNGSGDLFKPSDFCEAKTADYIEELLKNNSCIKTVYLPNHGLINRLNAYGSKVIYRKFVNDDRYAIEVGDTNCNMEKK